MELEFLLIIIYTILTFLTGFIKAHGRLIEPPSRASMWRYGFNLPQNDYDDNQGYCGGQQQLWNRFGGVCGVCGDSRFPLPRAHERGGRYYAGTIVKDYREGQVIEVTTHVTANHRGWYEFRLCAYDDPSPKDLETDNNGNFVEVSHECLNKHLLELEEGGTRWYLPPPYKVGLYTVKVRLPRGVSCNNCLFQWKWNVANSWGKGPNGESCIGCGNQEQFYACADISITPRSGQKPLYTWRPPFPKPERLPERRPATHRPHYVTPAPRPKTQRPKPQTQRPKPRPKPSGDRSSPNKPREFPKFTYIPKFTRPKLPQLPPGRTPKPPHFTPIRPKHQPLPQFPGWIPTQRPTWPWFTVGPKFTETTTTAPIFYPQIPVFHRPTYTHRQTTQRPSSVAFKFWDWLSEKLMPDLKIKPTTTTVSPNAPWWVKLPSNNKVSKWWDFISKIQGRKNPTTSLPLPWWVKKAQPNQELLPKFLNEKGESVEGDKELNGISAAASKIGPVPEDSLETLPVVRQSRKLICTPVGEWIQKATMWIWCDENCSGGAGCPKSHCICTESIRSNEDS